MFPFDPEQVTPETGSDRKVKKQPHPATPRNRATLKSTLTYPEFLDALLVLGERLYNEKVSKVEELPATKVAEAGSRHCGRSVESMFQQVGAGLESIQQYATGFKRMTICIYARCLHEPLEARLFVLHLG